MTREELPDRNNCGPVNFTRGDNAFYERHLTFDQVIPVSPSPPRSATSLKPLRARSVMCSGRRNQISQNQQPNKSISKKY